MSPDTIDKRTFLDTLPCPTRGWYAHRAPHAELTPADEWSFYGGNQVGEAARTFLGFGLMMPRTPVDTALDTTKRNLGLATTQLLFEASFRWDAFTARADALRRNGDGWDLVEVKSSKEPDDGKLKGELIDDLAYTLMVARNAGLRVERCVLLLLSRAYRLAGDAPLFVEFDVTDKVATRAEEFTAIAPELAEAVLGLARPAPDLKLACRPCDYFDAEFECLGHGIETSIFAIPGLSDKKLQQMKPIVDVYQLPMDVDLTDKQRRVFEVVRSGKPLVMPGLAQLDQVIWPVHYLDFETVSPFLPWFDGGGVHEVHPFQYSIHHRDGPDAEPTHREYLAPLAGDWRRELTLRLLDDLGDRGSVMMYTDFEAKRLRELAAAFPDLADRIDAVIARLFDLHDVVKDGYCHPGFRGKTSIKNVYPALCPDAAGYAELPITEGQSASGVFGLMRVGKYAAETFDEHRANLLAYCKLDTLAMVQVHQALAKVRIGG